jgi:hypothetical protein
MPACHNGDPNQIVKRDCCESIAFIAVFINVWRDVWA